MRPLIAHSLIAAVLFGMSSVLGASIELVIRRRWRSESYIRLEWTFFIVMAVLAVSSVCAYLSAIRDVAPLPGGPWWPVWAGLLVFWTGVALRLWAILTLGRFFKLMVVIQEDHCVVEAGPYRWLRHPSYLGVIVSLTGIGLIWGDWLSVAIMLVGAVTAFLARILVEERALQQALGDDYSAYMRRTARLVPGLF